MREYTRDEFLALLIGMDDLDKVWEVKARNQVNRILSRGDGLAVYMNGDLSSSTCGEVRMASYGSPAAQLETDTPPIQLPDIGNQINWRYQLSGTYKGEQL